MTEKTEDLTSMLRDITRITRAICPGSSPKILVDPDYWALCADEGQVRVTVRYALPSTEGYYFIGCLGKHVTQAASDLRDVLLRDARQQRDALTKVLGED